MINEKNPNKKKSNENNKSLIFSGNDNSNENSNINGKETISQRLWKNFKKHLAARTSKNFVTHISDAFDRVEKESQRFLVWARKKGYTVKREPTADELEKMKYEKTIVDVVRENPKKYREIYPEFFSEQKKLIDKRTREREEKERHEAVKQDILATNHKKGKIKKIKNNKKHGNVQPGDVVVYPKHELSTVYGRKRELELRREKARLQEQKEKEAQIFETQQKGNRVYVKLHEQLRRVEENPELKYSTLDGLVTQDQAVALAKSQEQEEKVLKKMFNDLPTGYQQEGFDSFIAKLRQSYRNAQIKLQQIRDQQAKRTMAKVRDDIKKKKQEEFEREKRNFIDKSQKEIRAKKQQIEKSQKEEARRRRKSYIQRHSTCASSYNSVPRPIALSYVTPRYLKRNIDEIPMLEQKSYEPIKPRSIKASMQLKSGQISLLYPLNSRFRKITDEKVVAIKKTLSEQSKQEVLSNFNEVMAKAFVEQRKEYNDRITDRTNASLRPSYFNRPHTIVGWVSYICWQVAWNFTKRIALQMYEMRLADIKEKVINSTLDIWYYITGFERNPDSFVHKNIVLVFTNAELIIAFVKHPIDVTSQLIINILNPVQFFTQLLQDKKEGLPENLIAKLNDPNLRPFLKDFPGGEAPFKRNLFLRNIVFEYNLAKKNKNKLRAKILSWVSYWFTEGVSSSYLKFCLLAFEYHQERLLEEKQEEKKRKEDEKLRIQKEKEINEIVEQHRKKNEDDMKSMMVLKNKQDSFLGRFFKKFYF